MVKTHSKSNAFDVLNMVILCLIGLSTVYPFIHLVAVSFSPISEVMKSDFMLIPSKFTLEAYIHVFKNADMVNAYRITIFITVVGTLVNLFMTSLGAYFLSNKQVPGRNFCMTLVIITMLFHGGLIPNYLVVKAFGMIDTVWALIIPSSINAFWMILMRNFFQSIPSSLGESARMDGCSEYRILFGIILPLSLPVIATLALFYGVGHWNAYFGPLIYLNSPSKKTLQMVIRAMYNASQGIVEADVLPPPVETVRAATLMIATVPILCLYPFLQRFFVKGIMVGAIKG